MYSNIRVICNAAGVCWFLQIHLKICELPRSFRSTFFRAGVRLLSALKVFPEVLDKVDVHEAQGRTVTMLASSTQVLAIFAVADTIKESSREAIAELHALGVHPSCLRVAFL